MPDDPTAPVRQFAETIAQRDVERALEACHPEIEFHSMLGELEGSTYHGHAGIRRYFDDIAATWDEWRPDIEDVAAAPDGRAVIVLHMRVRGRGSGVPLEQRFAHVWELKDGKLWRSTGFSDPDEAFRAVGLARAT
jgi:uncharacterized protein